MDLIRLEGLVVEAFIGVYPHEEGRTQRLVFDVSLGTDTRPAARSDDLAFTVDYDHVARICREVAASRHHGLVETVAETVASRVLEALPLAMSVWVRVAKPGAVPDAACVAVEISRDRRPEPDAASG